MPIVEGLGEALKLLRNRRGWPQKQLAADAGITRGMVSSYEKGKQIPTFGTLEKMLKALEGDFCDLHCAVEFVNGRAPTVHGLSPQFQPGLARSSKVAARKQPDPRPASAKEREPSGEPQSAPQSSEDLERALSDTVASVHRLLRHVLLGPVKPR
jgi:transcriptional regulator with XRE-family HTH domain